VRSFHQAWAKPQAVQRVYNEIVPDLSANLFSQHYGVWRAGTTQGRTSSRSNIILGEHLSGALIQLLRATYFFKARQQIVRP